MGNCYLKANMLGGVVGSTGYDPSITATCVNGAEAWMAFAQQVGAPPCPPCTHWIALSPPRHG
jgi:hypothetical protein